MWKLKIGLYGKNIFTKKVLVRQTRKKINLFYLIKLSYYIKILFLFISGI